MGIHLIAWQIWCAAIVCLLISLLAPFVLFPMFRWLWDVLCGVVLGLYQLL
jgi:hypothetical protein